MTNPYLQRPPRPNQSGSSNKPNGPQQSGNSGGNRNQGNNRRDGGGHNSGGGGRGGGDNHREPSMWLIDSIYEPHTTASFVEYLRWMRPDSALHKKEEKEGTKVQLVSTAEMQANYQERLRKMNGHTRSMAGEGNTFEVSCPWRIRVGGAKGPESMLLPAFDHVGMPYIPSSTLRGVARAQGIREFIETGMPRSQAEKEMAKYLGDLDAEDKHKAGKVIFLDAYPIPANELKSGGLAVDIANKIWSWEENNLKYNPNPNVFFSLKGAKFLIGIRKGINCTDEIFTKVKGWLIKGLEQGVGSQINSGYGRLIHKQASQNPNEFLHLKFELEGQLIHGAPKVTWNASKNTYDNRSIAEVRPVAFKNMLRYWFRAFGLGVLPAKQVQEWEDKLFGRITPQPQQGWIRVEILDGRTVQQEPSKNAPVGQQSGTLVLSLSNQCPDEQQESAKKLFSNLTWLMFHLGGVGQGARRPCYSRQNRDKAPWWRGSTLIPRPQDQDQDKFWELPDTAQEFKQLAHRRIANYFDALSRVCGQSIDTQKLKQIGQPNEENWEEAVDANCQILISPGNSSGNKPFALEKLHEIAREIARRGEQYNRFLCGGIGKNPHPSPVWIADLEGYEVVTVFGATADPRRRFVDELKRQGAVQVFPFTQSKDCL